MAAVHQAMLFRDSMEGEHEEFQRQLHFIIKQLNKTEEEDEENADSDDEGDEDDDEVSVVGIINLLIPPLKCFQLHSK